MPYINKKNRKRLDPLIYDIVDEINTSGADIGALNYVITKMCNDFVIDGKPRYFKVNEVLGVLEAVKLEFYRRLGGPYEDGAIEKNGDIECYNDI